MYLSQDLKVSNIEFGVASNCIDGSEHAFACVIGYYELAEETGAKFVPQNSFTVQFDKMPTQSFASTQNADANPTLEGVLVQT